MYFNRRCVRCIQCMSVCVALTLFSFLKFLFLSVNACFMLSTSTLLAFLFAGRFFASLFFLVVEMNKKKYLLSVTVVLLSSQHFVWIPAIPFTRKTLSHQHTAQTINSFIRFCILFFRSFLSILSRFFCFCFCVSFYILMMAAMEVVIVTKVKRFLLWTIQKSYIECIPDVKRLKRAYATPNSPYTYYSYSSVIATSILCLSSSLCLNSFKWAKRKEFSFFFRCVQSFIKPTKNSKKVKEILSYAAYGNVLLLVVTFHSSCIITTFLWFFPFYSVLFLYRHHFCFRSISISISHYRLNFPLYFWVCLWKQLLRTHTHKYIYTSVLNLCIACLNVMSMIFVQTNKKVLLHYFSSFFQLFLTWLGLVVRKQIVFGKVVENKIVDLLAYDSSNKSDVKEKILNP